MGMDATANARRSQGRLLWAGGIQGGGEAGFDMGQRKQRQEKVSMMTPRIDQLGHSSQSPSLLRALAAQ